MSTFDWQVISFALVLATLSGLVTYFGTHRQSFIATICLVIGLSAIIFAVNVCNEQIHPTGPMLRFAGIVIICATILGSITGACFDTLFSRRRPP